MFLHVDQVFPGGRSTTEIDAIHRPRRDRPFSAIRLSSGRTVQLWSTHGGGYVDLDIDSAETWGYLMGVLDRLQESGVKQVHLKSIGHVAKKRGTSSFLIPETYEFLEKLTAEAHRRDMKVIAEIHSHHLDQIAIAAHADAVYDFVLPIAVLHARHTGNSRVLVDWLTVSPRNAISVLDTDKGIITSDVAGRNGRLGLLNDDSIAGLVATIHQATGGESRDASRRTDAFEINTTYLAALGSDEQSYVAARVIQFFSPGSPQLYYAGLLATPNDALRVACTGDGRDINRPSLSSSEVTRALRRPVVQALCSLARFRNHHPAFAGELTVSDPSSDTIELAWNSDEHSAVARVSTRLHNFSITFTRNGEQTTVYRCEDLPVVG